MPNLDSQDALRTQQSGDMAKVVESCNQLAFDLHSKLSGEPGNLFFSPSSISMALAMTFAGAAGVTAEEMSGVLHSTLPEDRFHEGFLELRTTTRTGGVELKMANRLWGQTGYRFFPEFLQATERCYGARLAEVDFVTTAEEARLNINAWVAEQTAEKIKNLISPGSLPPLTRLILTNAIYFKGSWENEFDEADTSEAPFWSAPGTSRPVRLMRQTESLRYGEFGGLQVLELPYRSFSVELQPAKFGDAECMTHVTSSEGGSDLAMCILLPRQTDGLREIESRLNAENLREWTTLRSYLVDAAIPKFRIESSFCLNKPLQALGMRQAFSAEEADFSRMSKDPDGLFIGAAIHQAFVDVNEKGTEAAAATGIVMAAGCAAAPEPPKIFRADRPFMFLIRDRETHLIHFVGRVVEPERNA